VSAYLHLMSANAGLYAVIVAILVASVALRVRKTNHLQRIISSVEFLEPARLERIADYFGADSMDDLGLTEQDFWRDSRSVRGLIARLREVRYVLRVLQSAVALNLTSAEEAMAVKQLAYKQVSYTLLALPEALVCRYFKELAHNAAFQATRFHYLVTTTTVVLCQVPGAPMQVMRYDALV